MFCLTISQPLEKNSEAVMEKIILLKGTAHPPKSNTYFSSHLECFGVSGRVISQRDVCNISKIMEIYDTRLVLVKMSKINVFEEQQQVMTYRPCWEQFHGGTIFCQPQFFHETADNNVRHLYIYI